MTDSGPREQAGRPAALPDPIPRQVLFGNPERTVPRLSPDGTRLAWLAPRHGVLNVWVAPLDDLGRARAVTDDRDRGVRAYDWAHDGRTLLYLQDRGGDENWRAYGVDLISGDLRDFTPFDDVQAQLIDSDKRHPDRVLLGLNRDNPELHDVYSLDLATGELTKVEENPGFIGWVADADFDVRAAVAPKPDGGMTLLVRDKGSDEWRPLLDVGQADALTTQPVGFSLDGASLLAVSSAGADTARLLRLDLAPQGPARAAESGVTHTLASDPEADVGGVMVNPDTRRVEAATFVKERSHIVVLDDAVGADVAALQELHHGDLAVVDRDDADRRWLAAFVPDDGPVAYYLWERDDQRATFLFEHQPALAAYDLAPMEPFTIPARDGLTLHGYLTFPRHAASRQNLPVVLNVHGGPWARDTWAYQPEAQWLADRGYLCVQVNFRGSTGYGKAFLNAGDREWGAKMHDDLIDTVDWVVAQGYADPSRVAIFGGSYGGYAALAGAAFTPDVFAAAVDIVGPSNLITLLRSIPPYWAPMIAQFHTRVGNPDTEEDFLWSRSPLSKAEDIRIPLLIAQGANDPRVKQAESEQIVAALAKRGIDHQYLLFPDEGHGFAKPENRLRFYAAAEAFLAQHLGGRAEP